MKKEVMGLFMLIIAGCSYYPQRNMTAVFFDVGQGDSALLATPDGKNILIDCGIDKKASEYLLGLNITRIDVLLITHPDNDHSGGCEYVRENIFVERVLTNSNVRRDFRLSRFAEIITAYDSHGRFKKDNDNSVLLKAEHGKVKFLFAGDCEHECEKELIRTADLEADVLKAGHHGSKYSSTKEFLEMVGPSVAVVSVGENEYGHPHNETLERFSRARVMRTDINGTVIITTDGNGISVK